MSLGGFILVFRRASPSLLFWIPLSPRALNTTERPFIILEDFESSPFNVPLNRVRDKVDSELKTLQNRSKYHFWGKGWQCIIGKARQHLNSIDPYISLQINNWFWKQIVLAPCVSTQTDSGNLRDRTGEERTWQSLYNKRDNNFVWNKILPN